jgi:glycosyltransferase involved in cell wall biosynthesis
MSALRILHVVPYYEQAWAYGGIPRLATTMTRGLAARGHRVTVCTTDVCDPRSRAGAPAASPVDVRVFPNVSNRLAYHYQFFTPVGLRRFLREHVAAFDVAHLHACRHLPGEMAARLLKGAGVPYVVSPNGTAPRIERRFFAKGIFDLMAGRGMLDASAMVLAVSQAERGQLIHLGIPPAKIQIVPNPIDESEYREAIDPARFRQRIEGRSEPLVLFLGKLTPRKGVDVLLHAFQHVPRPARLVIAGSDMGAGADVNRLIRRLNLGDRVTRVGLLEATSRLEALAAASVVVYPSRDEVFGLVAMEALMCGSPVVVCDDSGCGEIIAETGGGLAVPYGDVGALATAIDQILEGDGWRRRARAASLLVRQRFGSVSVCAELEAAYRKVA